jgi:hypothetical protein
VEPLLPRPTPQSERSIAAAFLRLRRPGEGDRRLGVRLALSAPIIVYMAMFVVMFFFVDGESGLGVTLAYWLLIGLAQLIYLVPTIAIVAWRGRTDLAKGLALGGGIIAAADLAAWGLGVYVIGPR